MILIWILNHILKIQNLFHFSSRVKRQNASRYSPLQVVWCTAFPSPISRRVALLGALYITTPVPRCNIVDRETFIYRKLLSPYRAYRALLRK